MEKAADLEKKLLELPALEREQVIIGAWESLVSDPDVLSSEKIDEQGIMLAKERDSELESGISKTVSQKEFLRLTGENDAD